MKVRPAANSLPIAEAMERAVEVRGRAELLAHLREHYDFWAPTDENVACRYHGRDQRIGWDTYLITVAGHAALFSDGPIPEGA